MLLVAPGFPAAADDPHKPFLLRHAASLATHGADVTVVAPAHPDAPSRHVLTVTPDAPHPAQPTSPQIAVERVRFAPPKFAARAALGDTYRRLRGIHTPWAVSMLAALTYRTAALTRRIGADVIHGHWWYPGGLAAVLAGRLTGTPSVVHVHGSDVALATSGAAKLLATATMRAAKVVLAVSEPLAHETRERTNSSRARRALPPIDVRVVPMPVAASATGVEGPSVAASATGVEGPSVAASATGIEGPSVAASATANRPIGATDVLGVGRLVREKGFDVLISAVARAQQCTSRTLRVALIGDGSQRLHLASQAARLGVDLHLVGPLPPGEVAAAYACARVVAVPSRREGFGLVAAEAVAAGRPVVATDVGGARDLLARSAHPSSALVAPDDEAALAAALIDALAHPDHHNHYPVTIEPLSAQHHATTLLNLYREAATR